MPDISESIPINEFNRQAHFDKALIDPPYDVPCTVAGSFHLKHRGHVKPVDPET